MRRAPVLLASIGLIVSAGCGRSYERRLDATLRHLEYVQDLDQNLKSAAAGPFQALGLYLRVPKALDQAQQPGLNAPAGHYDLLATFIDPKAGTAPIRLHVLARVNRKAAPAKKKDQPAGPAIPRGGFKTDVLNLLASDLGGPDAMPKSTKETKRGNRFDRLRFKASNGDDIRVYFLNQGEYDVALVWDIPPDQKKSPTIVTGAELAMKSMAVGQRAAAAFQGGDSTDEGIGGEGGAPAGAAPF